MNRRPTRRAAKRHCAAPRRGLSVALAAGLALGLAVFCAVALGHPLGASTRARITAGGAVRVIVEYEVAGAEAATGAERARRGLRFDDAALLAFRAERYATAKLAVEQAVGGADAVRLKDLLHLPLAVWRVSSGAALARLEAHAGVRRVHEDVALHPVSVSDLGFINAPQAVAEGARGSGTTIAVIDGGLGSNYLNYPDFGTCTAVGIPATTCRVVVDQDFYPGLSTETVHGTNVPAIALGVASGARLAMFDVFNGGTALASDILTAMNTVIADRATYNIVALNLSVGDGSVNAAQCAGSVFAAAISNLTSAGVQTVAAAGNSGAKTGLADPACVSGAVSVGAVYDGRYGPAAWQTSPTTTCTDSAPAADQVTCFSQSASYLSLLAPGSFVNAPNSSFQQSGTSQASPHVAGAVAVLPALYPAESLGETLARLQLGGVPDKDAGNGLSTPRLNLLAATHLGTSLALTGSGPASGTTGQRGTYTLTATNGGPLVATSVTISDTLPPGATLLTATSGCTLAGSLVTCRLGTLAVGATVTATITVRFGATGPVYDSAAVGADQRNSAGESQQVVALGTAPASGDGPLPPWAFAALGLALAAVARRRLAGV